MTETPRERLARLMDERREKLGLDWNDVIAGSGLTKTGLHHVRFENRTMRASTKRGIENALRWEPGSIDSILDGGDPVELPEPPPVVTKQPDLLQMLSAGLSEMGATIAQAQRSLLASGAMGMAYRGDIDKLRAALAALPAEHVREISAAAALLASTADEVLSHG
ncbi:hypothetical protein [Microbispora rosea]|uniref:hypothetical protein n=1 Tax=Microbispora rosea TaxID=58117 RepID=UPI0037B76A35